MKSQKNFIVSKELIKNSFRVCVTGSYGKSTIINIVGLALKNINKNCDVYSNIYHSNLTENNKGKGGKISLVEIDQQCNNLLNLNFDASIIISLDKDSFIGQKNESEIISLFRKFIEKHSDYSPIIVNGDDLNIRRSIVPYQNSKKIITFGFNSSNDYLIKDIILTNSSTTFSVYRNNQIIIKDLTIKIPGFYNILNFTVAIIFFNEFNFSFEGILKVAQNFIGLGRRFEIKKSLDGKIFVDDYAHYPTQVRNLFYGLKQFYPKHKICAIFQPQENELIKNSLKEYGASFKLADDIILADSFNDDKNLLKDRSKASQNDDILKSIQCYSGKKANIKNKFEDIVKYIKENFNKNTIIATIGMGDIYKIRDLYFKKFKFN